MEKIIVPLIFLAVLAIALVAIPFEENETVYVILTIDTEQDLPPYLETYKGIEEGMPKITELLDKHKAKATFLVTGDVASRYPGMIKQLDEAGHEIGSHGFYHEDFNTLNTDKKKEAVSNSTRLLAGIIGKNVTSFRAPYHSSSTDLVNILEENGYLVEASANPSTPYPYHPSSKNWLQKGDMKILRTPVSLTPFYFYPTSFYQSSWIDGYKDAVGSQGDKELKVVVVGMHPWEFVEIQYDGQEIYTRVSGNLTYEKFEDFLSFLDTQNVKYVTLTEFYHIFSSENSHP